MEPFVDEGFDIEDFPKGYTYKMVEDKQNKMVIRIRQITNRVEALEWLKKLNDVGLTVWRVQRTFPRAGKAPISNIFKQDMRCQHNMLKTNGNKKKAKNTDCPAIMKMLVKRTDVKYSRAMVKDNLLKDWPCIVKFNGAHNHHLFPTQPRPINDEIRQQLFVYFLRGHSPTSAHQMLKSSFIIQQTSMILAEHLLPDRATCAHLYHTQFQPQLLTDETLNNETIKSDVLISNYNLESDGGLAVLKTDVSSDRFIAVCTPIMRRVHQLVLQSSELVFVDSFATSLQPHHHLYILFTVTPAGGLPLGVIQMDNLSDDVFEQALMTLKNECFPLEMFYNRSQPQVIMCKASQQHREVFRKCFPKSILLSCHLSILRRTWRWILDPNNDIDRHDRLSVLQHVKDLLYSQNEAKFNENLDRIYCHQVMNNYPKFRSYLNELCDRKQEWALCYRANLPLRRHHSISYARQNISMLKQTLKMSKRCFNLTQSFDFVSTVYENYVTKVLTGYCNANLQPELVVRFLPASSNISEEDIMKHPSEDDVFIIKSPEKADRNYFVNVAKFSCSCSDGLTTKICQHLSAILLHKMLGNVHVESYNEAQTKAIISKVVNGKVNGVQPLLSVTQPQYQEMEVNALPAEIGFDHEELIQSEDSSLADLRNFTERLAHVSKENPDVFMPALKAMMLNVQQYASNEAGLAMAMHSFGKYSGYETIGYILENVDGL